MNTTCTKIYSDMPFAHRQWRHDGHCALIHGHNWTFEITFSANQLDVNGFVVDFGKLKPLKSWLDSMFDHTLVLSADDPQLAMLKHNLQSNCFAKVVAVPNCGAEGLARYLFHQINERLDIVVADYDVRDVQVYRVVVREDSKNFATYERA